MADVKISQLPAATTPVDGTEVLPIVQSATTKQVSIANLTAGRAMAASSLTLTTPLAVTSGGTGLATVAQGTILSATSANTFTATATPTFGVAGTTAGALSLSGSTSGVVTIAPTTGAAGTWTMQLPTSGGTNGYILTTNGSGVTTWTNPTALGVDLDVGGTAITGATDKYVLYNNNGTLGQYAVTGSGTTAVLSTSPTFTTSLTSPLVIGGTGTGSSLTLQSTSGVGATDTILFKVGNNGATTAATITSAGNLGVGTSPATGYILDASATIARSRITSSTGTNQAFFQIANTAGGFYLGRDSSTGGAFSSTAYSALLWAEGAYPMCFATNNTEKVRIDTYGSLLVGTTTSPTTTTGLGTISTPGTVKMGSSFLRNRIINGGFDIWQRGTSFVSWPNSDYAADRWYNGGQPSTATQSTDVPSSEFRYSMSISVATAAYATMGQRIEAANCIGLVGNNATLSFWYKSTSGTTPLNIVVYYANSVDNFSSVTAFASDAFTPVANTWTKYTMTINSVPSNATNGVQIIIFRDNIGASTTLYTGVQFEVGSIATPFERRQYGQELMLCQRYYILGVYATGFATGPTSADIAFSFPVPMRTTPTVTITGALTITDSVANYTQSSASAGSGYVGSNYGGFLNNAANFTGLTSFRWALLNPSGFNNPIAASAEL